MKKYNLIIIKFSIFIASLFVVFSCKKDFLERPPISNLSTENAVYDKESATSLLRGVYARLRTNKIYGDNYINIIELPSDDITVADNGGTDEFFDDFNLNSGISAFQSFWQATFESIQRANNGIELFNATPYLNQSERNQYVAECKFIRAYSYWLLVTVFGEVPLYVETPKNVDELYKPQSSISELYAQMENDLSSAAVFLPDNYDVSNKGRATKYAALSMLGKIYLYQQKWNQAKEVFKLVKESNIYKLNTRYADNFDILKENGQESLFEIQNSSGNVSVGGGIFSSDGGIQGTNNFRAVIMTPVGIGISFGQAIATRDIFNEFEPTDIRLRSSIYLRNLDSIFTRMPPVKTVYSSSGEAVAKGKSGDQVNGSYFNIKKGISGTNAWTGSQSGIQNDDGTNIPVIRYSDVLLMYAEAAAESGDLSLAVDLLNEVRARVNLPLFPYTTKYGGHNFPSGVINSAMRFGGTDVSYSSNLDDFRKALVHERRVELAFEYHRFNDLVRWSYIDNHPGSAFKVFESKGEPFSKSDPEDKKSFQSFHRLFPKPLNEVDKSRGTIKQNNPY